MRRMRSKKSIAIFSNKQWVFSIEMKTKLVQHVESDWMRDWKSVRVRKSESEIARESESEKVWGWVLSIEMKTKVVQHVKSDWMRDWMSVRVRKSEIVRESESEREWECDLVPSFCLTFRHFFDSILTRSPGIRVHRAGSQLTNAGTLWQPGYGLQYIPNKGNIQTLLT